MNRLHRAKTSPLDCTRSTFRGYFSSRDKLVAQISRNFRKELYDCMYRVIHQLLIPEGMVCPFYGDKFDDVVFCKGAGIFDGGHGIFGTVEDEHIIYI